MLANFLKSIDGKYKIEFRNDVERKLLIVRVTRGFLYKEVYIFFEFLSDEQHIIRAIRDTIDLLDDAFNNHE